MKKKNIPKQLQAAGIRFVKLKPRTKKPFEVEWPKNTHSYSDIQKWVDQDNNYGVQGGYGRLVIVDADTPEIIDILENKFPETFTVKTPRHGLHCYFFCDGIDKKIVLKKDTPSKKGDHFGEIIVKGSQAVGPGSIHPDTGTEYEVIKDLEIAEVSREQIYSEFVEYIALDLPTLCLETESENIRVVDVLNKKGIQLRRVGEQFVCGHPVHGSTNNNNFVVHPEKNVWHCFRCDTGGGAVSLIAVLEGIIDCTKAVPGGLRGLEFRQTCQIALEKYDFDIKKYVVGGKKLPQGEVLTRLCEEQIKTFSSNQQGEPFVVLPIDGHLEVCHAKNNSLRNWLAGKFREKHQHPPNSDAMKQAQIQVELRCSKSDQVELFNRVGWYEGAIYYDLTTPDWQGVKITRDGWEIGPLPPVFRRYKHQTKQVIPVRDGKANDFLKFCNIRENDQCLFLVTIATFFIPDIPHVIPNLDGTQGSGKSFTSKNIKGLVDPSVVMLMSAPKNLEQVQMIAEKHWVSPFDNISGIKGWLSDFLCRAVTGEGDMKRSLYTDDDEFIRAYRRCIVLNGIGTYADRPDLLDRSIIFDIPELIAKRSEEDIKAEWEQLLPGILGSFFTAISEAMGVVDLIRGHEAFRMSDFAQWGAALARPLGYTKEEFFKKYRESVKQKWVEAADVNTLTGKIVGLMQERGEWKGTFTTLLEEINPKSNRDNNLPCSERKLSSDLKRIGPLLNTNGLNVFYPKEREAGTGRKMITLSKAVESTMGVNVGVNVGECSVNVHDEIDMSFFT
ncbi:bifunctional DNA primase/polymerase [bacterium]|nr:bifunctional DNA primase/polymerase [bacterium]